MKDSTGIKGDGGIPHRLHLNGDVKPFFSLCLSKPPNSLPAPPTLKHLSDGADSRTGAAALYSWSARDE